MAELQTKIENENLSKQFVLNKETVTAWFEQFRPDVEAKKISATLIDALIKRIDILNEHITITFNNSELSCQKSLDFPMGSNEMSLVGVERFELPHVGIRIRSLTTWLHPKNWNQTIALILQVHLLKL